MLDVVLSPLLRTWSATTVVAVLLVALLPLILVANQAARAPHGRCATMLRRVGTCISPRRILNRTLLEVSLTVMVALAAVAIATPAMNSLAMRPASSANDLVRLYRRSVGPYEMTVLSDRSPVLVGIVNFSVMVKQPDGKIVRNARVALTASSADANPAMTVKAAAAEDTDLLAYLAPLDLSEAGRWRVSVQVTGPEGGGTVSFEVVVAAPPRYEQLAVQVTIGAAAFAPFAWWRWRRFSRQATDVSSRQCGTGPHHFPRPSSQC